MALIPACGCLACVQWQNLFVTPRQALLPARPTQAILSCHQAALPDRGIQPLSSTHICVVMHC